MLLAEHTAEGRAELLAGSIFLTYGSTVHYAFTGCRTQSLELHVNDLIQWEAIQHAHREGFRYYDFGEVAEERQGLADFKSKWRAKPVPLYRYQFPAAAAERPEEHAESSVRGGNGRLLTRLWQHMPLQWTEFVSDHLFRRL